MVTDKNYKEVLSKYIDKIIMTKDLAYLFGTDNLNNKINNGYHIGGKDTKLILNKGRKFCEIESVKKNSGKYIIKNLFDDVDLTNYSYHPLYKTLHGMIDRCNNEKMIYYYNYGGRGITVCNEWLDKENGLKSFIIWAEQNGYIPNKGLTIDRIDNDKGYFPENCRWVTWDIQIANRRTTKRNMVDGHNIEEYNGLFLTSLYYNKKSYPVGTFNNIEDALEAKYNLFDTLEEINENKKG